MTEEEHRLRHELCRQCLGYARYLRGMGIPFGPDMKQRLRDYLIGLFDGIQISTLNNIHPTISAIEEIGKRL